MVIAILMGSFLVLMMLKVPISIAMGLSSLFALMAGNYPLTALIQFMGQGVMSYTLMAVPFFVLAGYIMNEAGLTNRIFQFAMVLVGHLRGGIAQVNILASMIFAGISGSFVADTAGLGVVEMKTMVDRGYDKHLAAAVTVSSSIVGPIIPPSIILIIYAINARVSIARIFLGGLLPGIIIGLLLMLCTYYLALKKPDEFPKEERSSFKEFFRVIRGSFLAVISPLIILWGIVGGVITPTEAGVLAVTWSVLVGIIYKELSFHRIPKVLYDSFLASAHIMFLVAVGNIMGWIISMEGASDIVASLIGGFADNRIAVLILINIIALILGCLIQPTPALLISFPIFEPIVTQLGVDPIHFGIILAYNLCIGMLTPPISLGLFVMCSVADVKIEPLFKQVVPFLVILFIGLILITYVPILSTWLPRLLMPY